MPEQPTLSVDEIRARIAVPPREAKPGLAQLESGGPTTPQAPEPEPEFALELEPERVSAPPVVAAARAAAAPDAMSVEAPLVPPAAPATPTAPAGIRRVASAAPPRVAPAPIAPPPQPPPAPRGPETDMEAAVWSRVQLARNLNRPRTLELMAAMADEFVELHGDRLYRDDEAIVGGLASLDGRRVVVIGHQKGTDTDDNIRRNFGMAHPEGYRKAMRLMDLAERFALPVVTLVDTPGASPGAGAEERGVAEAIARSIARMTRLKTPIVATITGEGGSGGALAIAVGDVVLALENAVYSVISPEGCASILWRAPELAPRAAVAMRITAAEQQALGVVDLVVAEPAGGAHRDHAETGRRLRGAIVTQLDALAGVPIPTLLEARYQRYRQLGEYTIVMHGVPAPIDRPRIGDRLRQLLEAGRNSLGKAGRDEPPAHDDV